ncbi:MAG: hypothetical protein JNK82_38845 [Myxococcaceae bacterium]|nr:hypothetical protein [Myxococcaceae bacterium]
MSSLTACPSCRRPLVVPNPAKCSCGAELGAGSRERTTPADPPPPPKTPLLTVVVQTEAQLQMLEGLVAAGVKQHFEISMQPRLIKDADLSLAPGTLNRELAKGLNRSAESMTDVPAMVNLVTFNELSPPGDRPAHVARLQQLTTFGRIAAESPAARALLLHLTGQIMAPAEFLRQSAPRPDAPHAELMVWVYIDHDDRAVTTRGLRALGFPEVEIEPSTTPDERTEAALSDVLLSAATHMLARREVLPDGFEIGTWRVTHDPDVVRLVATARPSCWRRLFS